MKHNEARHSQSATTEHKQDAEQTPRDRERPSPNDKAARNRSRSRETEEESLNKIQQAQVATPRVVAEKEEEEGSPQREDHQSSPYVADGIDERIRVYLRGTPEAELYMDELELLRISPQQAAIPDEQRTHLAWALLSGKDRTEQWTMPDW